MIDKNNFVQIAIKAYDNPQCKTLEQFNDDVYKFSLVKKLLKFEKYESEYIQMTLNNIVALYNVFECEECTKMLFFKVRKEHWHKLKTYIIFLGYMPEEILDLNLKSSDIQICQQIAKELRAV